ncbi:MAG: hypothetical protein ACREEA_11415 [Stellaceae bacterium]
MMGLAILLGFVAALWVTGEVTGKSDASHQSSTAPAAVSAPRSNAPQSGPLPRAMVDKAMVER